MKIALIALALVSVVAAPVSAATCIDSRKIDSAHSDDGKTMIFKMKDGTTMVNHLQGICSDLKFNGFAWTLHSGDTQICENQQSLRVIQSGQICVLGKFDPPKMSKGTN